MTKITIDRSVVEQVLEALEDIFGANKVDVGAINALRAALAEPGQEPEPPPEVQTEAEKVAYCAGWWAALEKARKAEPPLYAAPPQRKPLTEKEMYAVEEEARKNFRLSQKGPRGQQITYWDGLTPWLIRAVERAHGIKEN